MQNPLCPNMHSLIIILWNIAAYRPQKEEYHTIRSSSMYENSASNSWLLLYSEYTYGFCRKNRTETEQHSALAQFFFHKETIHEMNMGQIWMHHNN